MCLGWRFVFGISSRWSGTTTTAGINPLPYLLCRRCPDLSRRFDSVRSDNESGRSRLAAVYLSSPYCGVPGIVAAPKIYNEWGKLLRAVLSRHRTGDRLCALVIGLARETLARAGRILLGICAASFTLEQAIYLHATTNLVRKWLRQSDVLGANDDCFVRTRSRGSPYESNALLATRY